MTLKLLKAAIPLTGVVFFGGISGYLIYLLFKQDEEEIEVDVDSDSLIVLVTERIVVSKQAVGRIIGRQGSNVQIIQRETCTNINFCTGENSDRQCVIRGQKENVEKAKIIILKYIEDFPNSTEIKFTVPQSAVGKIIGKRGNTISNISQMSGAKIFFEKNEENFETADSNVRIITIQGTKESVEAAKMTVMAKVREDNVSQKVSGRGAQFSPAPEMKTEDLTPKKKHPLMQALPTSKGNYSSILTPLPLADINLKMKNSSFSQSMDFKNVFVTAVASANLFWVQISSKKLQMLNKLTDEMSKFYSQVKNRTPLRLEDRIVGKMVAATYPRDEKIYRGRIAPYEQQDDPLKVVIYYVDYGDVELLHPNKVYPLKEEFNLLDFQAVECTIHGADVIPGKEVASTAAFESITQCGKFIPIKAKLGSYKQLFDRKIPALDLICPPGMHGNNQELNVVKELINKNLLKVNSNLPSDKKISSVDCS